eukprot:CAMPEP_0183714258 /NCGR_PEP_ID=MMETSP0737-20130205/8841_1 /TAXON_ID=385413 /ORGANISM="Thalassiosira miniscula, Strain CCMP1093" /LENGTH=553 /DNA_ID=CAMNT_0025943165 /DNA_START=354 /DNA_END=2015 /DNA_ORIENTATION=+
MGRGKNNRRRASLDGPAPNMNMKLCAPSSPTGVNLPLSLNNAPTTHEEILDAIEFHWKNLSMELKEFLLANPQELSLRKFVDFWTNPLRYENTNPNIAASICGCSWYLALNYMSIGKIVEARALILNGCFLQQCYNKPIEEIAAIARSISGEQFREKLPFFTDGLLAISTEERMSAFLRNKVSSDYQRRMSFATQTTQTKKKVQDYVSQIGSDWKNGSSTSVRKNEARKRRASVDSLPPESFIEIKFVDTSTKEETSMRYGLSMSLKNLFKKYAEDRSLNLRELRFSYEGRTLFLSSVGSKTPEDLGIKHLDSIMVVNNSAPSQREEESSSSSDESKQSGGPLKSNKGKGGKKSQRRKCRRASWAGPEAIINEEERLKLKHSRQLSRVFGEAAPQFEAIRQRLNVLNLSCMSPKNKSLSRNRKKIPVALPPMPLANPNLEGTGGKAGVPFYAVHVGASENLYNTKNCALLSRQKPISIDLHGYTKEDALKELDSKLPEWYNTAMGGSHPFMISVVIICGGGNQILSEAVDQWIKSNENVAKAPKKKYNRRRTM